MSDLTEKINNKKEISKRLKKEKEDILLAEKEFREDILFRAKNYSAQIKNILIDNYSLFLALNTAADDFCTDITATALGDFNPEKELELNKHSNILSNLLSLRLMLNIAELIQDKDVNNSELYESMIHLCFGLTKEKKGNPAKDFEKTIVNFLKDFNLTLTENLGTALSNSKSKKRK